MSGDALISLARPPLSLRRGEALALLGEGTQEVAQALLRKAGRRGRELRGAPRSSRHVAALLAPFRPFSGKAARRERAAAALAEMGLGAELLDDRARDLTPEIGRRVALARALTEKAELIVCDARGARPGFLELLGRVRDRRGPALVLLGLPPATAAGIADRAATLLGGTLCEIGRADLLAGRPGHPWTRALADGAVKAEAAEEACPYRNACPKAKPLCAAETPELRELGPEQAAACHFPLP